MKILYALGTRSPTSIPQEWAEGLETRGHDVTIVEATPDRMSFFCRVGKTARTLRPDVVHFHHTLPGLAAACPGPIQGDVGKILTVHRLMSDMNLKAWTAHTIGGLGVDAVVANSRTTLGTFPSVWRHSFVRRRVIYNGVDLARLDATRKSERAGKPCRTETHIVSVGRLIPDKGFDLLLEAVAAARQPVRLTLVGAGPERRRLEALGRSLGLGETLEFTGRIERDEVYFRLWSADLFALSSRTEGFCNAVVEAMAAEVPVVVTPAGALPEVVGSCGWTAENVSVEAVSAALRRALRSDESQLEAVGRKGARRARERFSLQRTLDDYERLYTDVAQLSSGRDQGRAADGRGP